MHTYLLTVPRSWQLECEIKLLQCDAAPIQWTSKHIQLLNGRDNEDFELGVSLSAVSATLLFLTAAIDPRPIELVLFEDRSKHYLMETHYWGPLYPRTLHREAFGLRPSYRPSVRRDRGLPRLVCWKDLKEHEVNELSI